MRFTTRKFFLAMMALGAVALGSRQASAVIYTIDPNQSFLTVSVSTQGLPLTYAQFLGSDSTTLSGTIDATVGGGFVTFTDTNNIVFANQANPVMPGPGGGVPSPGTVNILPDNPGSGTGNYGLVLVVNPDDPLNLAGAALGGYADIAAAIATLNGAASDLGGGLFDASTLNVGTFAGDLEYNLNQNDGGDLGSVFTNGTTGIGGNAGVNSLAGNGSLVGNTITVPITVVVTVDTGLIVVDALFSGQIVATAVPEPSTVALVAMGLVGLIPVGYRRFRRS